MVDVNTQFGGFLTNQGAAKKTNCDALGVPWKLTHMRLGDANGADPVPNPAQTQLVHQVARLPLNQLYVSPVDANVLIAELVLPPDTGGWWIRELALEDEDGVFSAVANCAPSYKPVLAQGSGRNQVVRMHILTSGTANIQLKIDPSVVLATRAYCDALIATHLAAADPHSQYTTEAEVALLIAAAAAARDDKQSVLYTTTAAIALNGLAVQAGGDWTVALQAGDRVLVKDQAAGKDNGLYTAAAGAWARAQDADSSAEVTPGMLVPVEKGTLYADSLWQLVTDAPIMLGTTSLAFEMAAGRTGVSAGTYDQITVNPRGLVVSASRAAANTLTANATLTAAQRGLVLLDATAGNRSFTLPAANAALGVVDYVLRRVDATANTLAIAAGGTDKIMLDTVANAAGQSTTELLFAGDFLHLRSDGSGKWWCLGQAYIPASLACGEAVFLAAGVATFTVPPILRAGRAYAFVRVVGGGAGGSRGSSSGSPAIGSGAGGGGGGGWAEKVVDLTGVASVPVTVGDGGGGSFTASSAGAAGSASSFGGYLSASGGLGSNPYNWGGVGGFGSGGSMNGTLGDGGQGHVIDGGSGIVISTGGTGGGGTAAVSALPGNNTVGAAAANFGAGGTGSTGAANGGAGKRGYVRISWGV